MEYMESKMQDYYEQGEARYNDLIEKLNPPEDWESPKWDEEDRVHNWRNYASKELKEIWGGMSGEHKMIVSACLRDVADREHWE